MSEVSQAAALHALTASQAAALIRRRALSPVELVEALLARAETVDPKVQAWQTLDLGSQSAYPTITGAIFEFGFDDAILQMWAAYLDELTHGRDGMRQPFHCATPEEAAATHQLFTAALRSHAEKAVVPC